MSLFDQGEVLARISSPSLADVGNYTLEAWANGRADAITLTFVMEGEAWRRSLGICSYC